MDLSNNLNDYLHLHADCIPVRGPVRSAVYDLTRHELIFFPTDYFEVLEWLTSDKIGKLLDSLESDEEKEMIMSFIDFLDENEFIAFLNDPSMFPKMQEQWDVPAVIQNAIIDVDEVPHDFESIFHELDELGCQYVQVRCFSGLLKMEDIYSLVSAVQHKSIESVELILKYDATIADETYLELSANRPLISSLVLHSAPADRVLEIDYGCDEETSKYIKKQVHFVRQQIDSQKHCGIITTSSLHAPTMGNFFETKLYNGCLNRKVSVDSMGEIRNCPSMTKSYGNISDTSLKQAINSAGFKNVWGIRKDQISICKDCELRYACSDCRAYLEQPADMYSKPLKCGYDPYTGEWEDWSQNPLKQQAIEFYSMKQPEKQHGVPCV